MPPYPCGGTGYQGGEMRAIFSFFICLEARKTQKRDPRASLETISIPTGRSQISAQTGTPLAGLGAFAVGLTDNRLPMPDYLTAIDGTSFILSDRLGNITGGVHGLYVRDCRYVSRW